MEAWIMQNGRSWLSEFGQEKIHPDFTFKFHLGPQAIEWSWMESSQLKMLIFSGNALFTHKNNGVFDMKVIFDLISKEKEILV